MFWKHPESRTGTDAASKAESLLSGGTETSVISGKVCRIDEKEDLAAVFLSECQVSVSHYNFIEPKLLVYIRPNQCDKKIKIGNKLRVSGKTEAFSPARNPGNFDMKFYYQKQGILYLMWAERTEILSEDTDVLRNFLYHFRNSWKDTLIRHLGEYYGNTMSAVLLGDKSGLDEDMKKMYQKNGIAHILAVSGVQTLFLA